MSVVLYRIDDRLVHGQVMTAWSKIYQTNRIFIVDDETADNQFLCDVMKMSVPREYSVTILNTAEAAEKIRADPPNQKTMVLMKAPNAAKALLDGGVDMKELNVGNMGAAAGRRAAMRNIQLSEAELATLRGMAKAGVRVYLQIFPDGKTTELSKVNL